jgi:hypothetical protein
LALKLTALAFQEATVSYAAEISRANPTCFVFLLDQSGSMQDIIGSGEGRRKSEVVADALNRLLSELAIRCAKEEGVRDYFHVSVLGYGSSVGPALGGPLAGRDLVPLSELASSPARLETRTRKVPDGAGGLVDQQVKFPVWVDPIANGGTPMSSALGKAHSILSDWLSRYPTCYPPAVLNLTDGESTDGDPTLPAETLRALASVDGNVMLFNLHVCSSGGPPITFPDSDSGLPNSYAQLMFALSSVLPTPMRSYAQQQGFTVSDGTRGFVYNADITAIIQFLDIGTRATDLR